MYDVPMVWYKMILYAMWYDVMALAYKLFVHSFFCLKAYSFFLYMATLQNAQIKIVIVYMREQTWGTQDDMIPIWYGMYEMYGVDH